MAEEKKEINPEWLEHFQKEGYSVIPDVLTEEKNKSYVSRYWDWLESLGTGIKRNDKKTWIGKNWPMSDRGILCYPSPAHTQFVWDLRSEDKVIEPFEKIHNTKELLVSFDRGNVTKPSFGKKKPVKIWTHTDQTESKLECVQGFVNLIDCGEEDAGLVVIPGSHKYHEEFFRENKIEAKGGYMLKPEDEAWFAKKGLKHKKVLASGGSLVVWDSRTFHYNVPPTQKQEDGKFRMVIYTCMTPKKWITAANLKKKKKAFQEMRTTKHSPHNIGLFPKTGGRNYGRDLSIFKVSTELPKLTKRGKQLAGLVEY
jgi:ectoine hydroxylase-related dioxygenase (phytanoyl-CoA dioxygenase family)